MRPPFKKTSKGLYRAFTQPLLIYITLIGNGFLLLCTSLVYFFEKGSNPHMDSFFNVLWWAVSTITTVGFGDIVPQTWEGRMIGIILMYTGTVLFVTYTSLLATFWVSRGVEQELLPLEEEMAKEERETFSIEKSLLNIQHRLDQLEKKL